MQKVRITSWISAAISIPGVPCSAVLVFCSVCLTPILNFLITTAEGYHRNNFTFNSNSKLENKAFVPVLLLQKKCGNLGTPLKKEDVNTAQHQASAAEYKVEAHSQNYPKFGDLGALWQHHGKSNEAVLSGWAGTDCAIWTARLWLALVQDYPKHDLRNCVDVP